ncbi:MAG: glutamine-hydrolyzing GMP synthase [Desulfurococcales archaeon]|nr:glutamine-hydrolyzing GMP synthase [Desulfurococcales archaeon]
MERHVVSVLDFGGQYGHLIARRMRELGYLVYHYPVESTRNDELLRIIRESSALILSGGPLSVWEERHSSVAREAVRTGKPVLGICYGHQLLAQELGGVVGPSPRPEFGRTIVRITSMDPLFYGVTEDSISVWMSHNDAVIRPPPGAKVLAVSEGSPVAAFKLGNVYGVQWHPEVHHSQYGREVLDNWASRIAGLSRGWNENAILELVIDDLRRQIEGLEGGTAISAVSGGVDSTVATAVVHRFARIRLVPVMIDHGFHPHGWIESSVKALENIGIKVRVVDASDEFLEALRGVRDPEKKRRVIARLYFEVLHREAERARASALVQGTIYPDIIESGAMPGAERIKTHHNVATRSLPGLRIIEPLRWLYKDEVRRLGVMLGLPKDLISRQPVPGPGLAVRVEGEITRDKLEIVRKADRIVREEVERSGLAEHLWQYFAVLTSSRATGVRGDRRAYGWVVAVRLVESIDAMTASIARPSWDLLERIASRIVSEVPGVARVVYDITSKPPATIEWE